MKKATIALALTVCCSFPLSTLAESFRAQVKVKLIDPANITLQEQDQAISVALIKQENSSCEIAPENGAMTGNSCIETNTAPSTLNLNGRTSQAISVKLESGYNASDASNASISFEPTLYNGQNREENFQLSASNHTINVGGRIVQHDTLSASTEQTQLNENIHYNVEVLYP